MKIVCTQAEQVEMIKFMSQNMTCDICPVRTSCNKNSKCMTQLENNIVWELTDKASKQSLGAQLKEILSAYISLKEWSGGNLKHHNAFLIKKQLVKQWDELNSGLPSEHFDKYAEYTATHNYWRPEEYINALMKVARGEKIE